jgi:Tol biopolymer transport system component
MAGLLLVEISDSGEVVGEPHTLPMGGGPDWLFGISWMPDGEHFLAVGGMIGSEGQDVWLVSLEPDTPPVNLTDDVQGQVWYFHLSPDGRYIAFESEIPRGTSIWRVDLGDILAGAGG